MFLPLVFLDDLHAGVGAMCTSVDFDSQMVDLGGQNLVIDYLVPHMVYYEKRPVVVANPMRFSTSTTCLRRALQAPQMQNARTTPEQAQQYTLHSLKATMLSISKQIDVPAEQGHLRQHGGRASVRLYSRDDAWGRRWHASNLLFRVWQKVSDHSGHGAQIPSTEPPVKIDPLTTPMEMIPGGVTLTPNSLPHCAPFLPTPSFFCESGLSGTSRSGHTP